MASIISLQKTTQLGLGVGYMVCYKWHVHVNKAQYKKPRRKKGALPASGYDNLLVCLALQ
jgi:hypothetical protein